MDALNRFMSGFAEVIRIPPPHRTPLRVDALVKRVAALMHAEDVAIRVDVDETTVSADEQQLEQALINVVRNAIDSGGPTDITLRNATLTVRDHGSGISEETRHSLFIPFFTTKADGRGLGLTIVQEILTNHGFAYDLRNAEGGGAEFTILLNSAPARG